MTEHTPAPGPGGAAPSPPGGADGAASPMPPQMTRVADEILPALVARLSASRLHELEIRRPEWRVRLRRGRALPAPTDEPPPASRRARGGANQTAPPGNGSGPNPPQPSAGGTRVLVAVGPGGDPLDAPSARGTRGEPHRAIARSPAVGYYAPRDALAVGQSVRAGDVLGHVDVLGVPQEVPAPVDGVLGRIYAQAGEAVEYGQELVRIDSAGRSDR